MANRNKNYGIFATSMTIIGAIVGAGFASGAEIATFFGALGWAGTFVAIPLFAFLFLSLLLLLNFEETFTQQECHILPFGSIKIGETVLLLCHFCLAASMIAGIRALCLLAGLWSLFPFVFSACGIILFFGLGFTTKISSFLLPLLLLFLFAVALAGIIKKPSATFAAYKPNAIVCSLNLILYVSMNTLVAAPVIVPLGKTCKHKKTCAFIASLLTGALFSLILLAVCGTENKSSMPILDICTHFGSVPTALCVAFLLVATITTLISCGFALVETCEKVLHRRAVSVVIVMGAASFASIVGFEKIVKYVYPVMGIIGVLAALTIFLTKLRIKYINKCKKSLEKNAKNIL